MTTYYTAADGTSQVATAGPADPKAPAVAKVYTVVSSLLGLVTLASTFNLITTDQASALSNVGTSVVGLVGAGITAVAAFRTNKQVKNGTFDAAPNLPVLNTFEQLNVIKAQVDQTVTETQDKVAAATAAIQNATAALPGGALVSGAVGVGSQAVQDLLAAVSAVDGK